MSITKKDLEAQLATLNRVSERQYTLSFQNGHTVLYRMSRDGSAPTLAITAGSMSRVSEILFAMVDAIVYATEE